MLKEVRLQQIHQEIKQNNSLDIAILAARFDVSTDTIRRDLSELANRGLIRKVRGGAMARAPIPGNRSGSPVKPGPSEMETARKAAALLEGSETILLDAGPSNLALARQLAPTFRGTVLTNSFAIASALCQHTELNLVFLGGKVHKESLQTLGMEVCEAVSLYQPDVYFMGVEWIHPQQGVRGSNREEALQKQWMIRHSVRVAVLLQEAQVQEEGTYLVSSLSDIDLLISTDRATARLKKAFPLKHLQVF